MRIIERKESRFHSGPVREEKRCTATIVAR
jgi:hypothetical protein